MSDERQLRLALAMRGGVSLAVWIGGAVAELDRVRRPPPGDAAATPDGDGAFWPSVLAASPFEEVVVDVIAGASAGGLNGVLYAASQVYGFPFDAMRDVWLKVGTTQQLVRHQGPWPSLFEGDDVFLREVHRALVDLVPSEFRDDERARQAVRSRPRLTLELAATVVEPVDRPVPSPRGEPLVDRRYGTGFRFRQPEEPWVPNDFVPESGAVDDAALWRLAIAARATSSYPVAFEAAVVHATRRATFAADSPPGGSDGAAIDLDGSFLDRSDGGTFVVADGGILDNIPIRRALDAVAAAPAGGPTERIVVYLHPGAPEVPVARSVVADEHRRASVTVLRGAVGARLGGETINADIEAIDAHNEAVERAKSLRRGAFRGVDGAGALLAAADDRWAAYAGLRRASDADRVVRLLLDPVGTFGEDPFPATVNHRRVDDDRWRSPIARWPAAAREQLGSGMSTVIGEHLPDPGDSSRLGQVVTAAGDPGPLWRVVEVLIEWACWLEDHGGEGVGDSKERLYRIRSFLAVVVRRTRALAWVAIAASMPDDVEVDVDAFCRAAVAALSELVLVDADAAGKIVEGVRSLERDSLWTARREALRRIDGIVDHAVLAWGGPGAVPARHGDTNILAALADLVVDVARPLAPVVVAEDGDEEAPGRLVHQALAGDVTLESLGALEVLTLPEFVSGQPGRRRLEYHRLSAANRTPIGAHLVALAAGLPDAMSIPVDRKLAGNELANFSAFLLDRWRANDWMWGRLDAVPTLVDVLVRPEALAAYLERSGGDPVEVLKEMVAPGGHPWHHGLRAVVWTPYADRIAAEVRALVDTGDGRGDASIPNIRNALIARRQWEILEDERHRPDDARGLEPGRASDDVLAWAAAYAVGCERIRGSGNDELIDRFDEIGRAASETLVANLGPGSPMPLFSKTVATAIRRAGPRVAHHVATSVVDASRDGRRRHRLRGPVSLGVAVLVVLGVLGWFIDRWAFLLGFAAAAVPLGAAIWWTKRVICNLLEEDPPPAARPPCRDPSPVAEA